MHRRYPISQLVYAQLFPNPGPNDPATFAAHLQKNLVGEVRIETATFYGSLDTTEARYPGLNYASAPHRKRLGRFPHHARLFQAFDNLGLTESEIHGFCRWEGTLWARERYQRDEGVTVQDTTGNEIGPWVDTRKSRDAGNNNRGIEVMTEIEVLVQNRLAGRRPTPAVTDEDIAYEEEQLAMRRNSAEEDEDCELQLHSMHGNSEYEQSSKDEQERAGYRPSLAST
jgi:hypothetical protein